MSGGGRRSVRTQAIWATCGCLRPAHAWAITTRFRGAVVKVTDTCGGHLERSLGTDAPRLRDTVTVRRIGGAA